MPDLNLTRRALTKLLGALSVTGSAASIRETTASEQHLEPIFPREGVEIPVGATVVFGVEPLEGDVTYQWTIEDGPEDDPVQFPEADPGPTRLYQYEERDDRVVTFQPVAPTEDGNPYVIEVTARLVGDEVGTVRFTIYARERPIPSIRRLMIDGRTPYELAKEYAPVLHLHEDELFYPTRYEAYVENSELRQAVMLTDVPLLSERDQVRISNRVREEITLLDLGDEEFSSSLVDSSYAVYTQRTKEELQDIQSNSRIVYASVHDVTYDTDDYIAITYWMFYLFDPKSVSLKEFFFSHPTDLESVTVFLDKESLEPRLIGAAQHKGGTSARWNWVTDNDDDDDRLDVYPAYGAHSSFLIDIEDYLETPIPGQWQFLSPSSTSTRTLPIGDRTGAAKKLVPEIEDEFDLGPDDEEYELILLTGNEHWESFDGFFAGESGALAGGQIPMKRERWADPVRWMDSELVPLADQIGVSVEAQKPTVNAGEVSVDFTVTHEGVIHHKFFVRAIGLPLVPGEDNVELDQRTLALPSKYDTKPTATRSSWIPATADVTLVGELPNVADAWDIQIELWPTEPKDDDDLEPVALELITDVQRDQRVSATISFVDPPDTETVVPDEPIERTARVENTGEDAHEFFVGYSAVSPEGRDVFNGGGGPVELDPGESVEVELEVFIPTGAQAGAYTLVTAVWEESDPTELETRLDEDRREEHVKLYPEPRVETTDVATDGDEVTVTVGAANDGPTAQLQSLSVSIPGVSEVEDAEIAASTFADERMEVIGPGTEQRGKYGETVVELDHVLVRAHATDWRKDETNSFALTVNTDQQDDLDVHVKTVATAPGVLAADPEPGTTDTTDQQGESVYRDRGDTTGSITDDANVYVGSHDGNLYAIEAATGNLVWTFNQPSDWVYSSPTVVDGTVYVGSRDGNLYAVDAATGRQEWAFRLRGKTIASPTVVDGSVYIGSYRAILYAVDEATGKEEWTFGEAQGSVGTPAVVDGTVYLPSAHGVLHALDASTGEAVWDDPFTEPGPLLSVPTVIDGTVYVGSNDGTLYAVDAATGDQEWTFDESGDRIISSAVVVDGTVYVGSEDGTLYAVDATTGDQQWAFDEPGDQINASPTEFDGTVFVGSYDETLYAVDTSTGDQEWSFDEPTDWLYSSPTVFDETVYVGSSDTNVYAVDARSGDAAWDDPFTPPRGAIMSSPTVVADPESGHSVGSRVRLGALGHHDTWIGGEFEERSSRLQVES